MKTTCKTSLSTITLAIFLSACGGSDNSGEKLSASESPERGESTFNKPETLASNETIYDDQLDYIVGSPFVEKSPVGHRLSAIKVCFGTGTKDYIQAIRFRWTNGTNHDWSNQYGAMKDGVVNCTPNSDDLPPAPAESLEKFFQITDGDSVKSITTQLKYKKPGKDRDGNDLPVSQKRLTFIQLETKNGKIAIFGKKDESPNALPTRIQLADRGFEGFFGVFDDSLNTLSLIQPAAGPNSGVQTVDKLRLSERVDSVRVCADANGVTGLQFTATTTAAHAGDRAQPIHGKISGAGITCKRDYPFADYPSDRDAVAHRGQKYSEYIVRMEVYTKKVGSADRITAIDFYTSHVDGGLRGGAPKKITVEATTGAPRVGATVHSIPNPNSVGFMGFQTRAQTPGGPLTQINFVPDQPTTTSTSVPSDAYEKGAWGRVMHWPVIGMHAVLMPTGTVLTYGSDQAAQQDAEFRYALWSPGLFGADDPEAQDLSWVTAGIDSFCSGQSVLSDTTSAVLLAGGDSRPQGAVNSGIKTTTLLDGQGNRLPPVADMSYARWYPTQTTLPNGKILTTGGYSSKNPSPAPHVVPEQQELYDPSTKTWKKIINEKTAEEVASGIKTLSEIVFGDKEIEHEGSKIMVDGYYYPRMHVSPTNRLFFSTGRSNKNYFRFDLKNTETSPSVRAEIFKNVPIAGNFDSALPSVMYRPGEIFTMLTDWPNSRSYNSTLISIAGESDGAPKFINNSPTAKSMGARFWSNMTLLPTGDVFINGGGDPSFAGYEVNYRTQIWTPPKQFPVNSDAGTDKGSYRETAPEDRHRTYHSTTLLLPDGRVLTTGGGSLGPVKNLNAQIFSPPYLFKKVGISSMRKQDAERPQRVSAPEALKFANGNSHFSVVFNPGMNVSSSKLKFSLVKHGSVTHSFNNGQSFKQLEFDLNEQAPNTDTPNPDDKDPHASLGRQDSTRGGYVYKIKMPNRNEVTPGRYMLFAIDESGTPSLARLLSID